MIIWSEDTKTLMQFASIHFEQTEQSSYPQNTADNFDCTIQGSVMVLEHPNARCL